MSEEEIQHLYEILDKKQFNDAVFEGLRRLLIALEERVNMYDDINVGHDMFWEAKKQYYEVRSILSALALPANHQGDPYYDVSRAFYMIDDVLQGFWQRRDDRIAAYKRETAAETSSPQAESGCISPTPSKISSSEAQEEPNTAPQDDHSPVPEPPLPPYVEFLVKLATEFGATATKMKKDVVRDRIEERWDTGALGERSAHKLEMMATLMRPPEAQKGRAKPKP